MSTLLPTTPRSASVHTSIYPGFYVVGIADTPYLYMTNVYMDIRDVCCGLVCMDGMYVFAVEASKPQEILHHLLHTTSSSSV